MASVNVDHGERPDLDPDGVYHQRVTFVTADRIPVPGRRHLGGMRPVQAAGAFFTLLRTFSASGYRRLLKDPVPESRSREAPAFRQESSHSDNLAPIQPRLAMLPARCIVLFADFLHRL
jgi:hypothetical protein